MQRDITAFLWFASEGPQAAERYISIMPRARLTRSQLHDETTAKASGVAVGTPPTLALEIAGRPIVLLNGGPEIEHTPATSLFVTFSSRDSLKRAWDALIDDGAALMQLDVYPFSELYGWLSDRWGVSWQLMLGDDDSIAPALMFTGENAGKAEQAIGFYGTLFDERTEILARYEADEADTTGWIKHARFTLDGNPFVAMDSGHEHGFTFTQAMSFAVSCADQAEIDRFWDGLSKGGEPGQCGWLEDRYGVSWQIVPDRFTQLMAQGPAENVERMMRAMMPMRKLIIADLERAYHDA